MTDIHDACRPAMSELAALHACSGGIQVVGCLTDNIDITTPGII